MTAKLSALWNTLDPHIICTYTLYLNAKIGAGEKEIVVLINNQIC